VPLTELRKAPFPYFGGKSQATPVIWAALGDVCHYVEPFCGSCAVLLRRPHECNRAYYSETVNDSDGLLVNALRAIQLQPGATAAAASWFVSEADLMSRHLAIVRWQQERDMERLMADPLYCDPTIAGYWIYGMSCWIGGGFASGVGPWIVGSDGRITRRAADAPGVARKLPHVSDDGQGVNHAGAREPGVRRRLPHVTNDGRGINVQTAREPGVGTGGTDLPDATDAALVIPDDLVFHPFVMPEVRRWLDFLSARLRHVRIVNGDYTRVLTSGVLFTLRVRRDDGVAGVFIDPPYSAAARRSPDLYRHDDLNVAIVARDWAIANGDDRRLRIVFAGFADEHADAFAAAGWRCVAWYRDGYLRGGLAQRGETGTRQHEERLWLSPFCLGADVRPMDSLWADEED
jgi:hypothetical protein